MGFFIILRCKFAKLQFPQNKKWELSTYTFQFPNFHVFKFGTSNFPNVQMFIFSNCTFSNLQMVNFQTFDFSFQKLNKFRDFKNGTYTVQHFAKLQIPYLQKMCFKHISVFSCIFEPYFGIFKSINKDSPGAQTSRNHENVRFWSVT